MKKNTIGRRWYSIHMISQNNDLLQQKIYYASREIAGGVLNARAKK
ncbi:MAG: hypothetical protein WCJ81_01095 [bacterium]